MRIPLLLTGLILSMSARAGEFAFFQIAVRDQAAAQDFYKKTLGWEYSESGVKGFMMVTNAGTPGGLWTVEQAPPKAGGVKLFFSVNNLRQALQEVERSGGKTTVQPVNVKSAAWVAEFEDLDGNSIGLHCSRGINCVLPSAEQEERARN